MVQVIYQVAKSRFFRNFATPNGELSEWLKEPASKTGLRASATGVRIPHSPQRLAKKTRQVYLNASFLVSFAKPAGGNSFSCKDSNPAGLPAKEIYFSQGFAKNQIPLAIATPRAILIRLQARRDAQKPRKVCIQKCCSTSGCAKMHKNAHLDVLKQRVKRRTTPPEQTSGPRREAGWAFAA